MIETHSNSALFEHLWLFKRIRCLAGAAANRIKLPAMHRAPQIQRAQPNLRVPPQIATPRPEAAEVWRSWKHVGLSESSTFNASLAPITTCTTCRPRSFVG